MSATPTERGVLAVLDREIARWPNLEAYSEGHELIEARAAVAELLEAADDLVNGEDPAAGCDDALSAFEAHARAERDRSERVRAAISRAERVS